MTAEPHEHLSEAVLRPVRGHHAFEACVEQLATAIRLGVYPVGSTLPRRARPRRAAGGQPRHAARGHGGAAPGRTRRDHARSRRRHRGHPPRPGLFARKAARLTPLQRQDWHDALEFRRVVEPGAAALAASLRLAEPDLDRLRKARDLVTAATRPVEHRQADSRFHLTLAALTGSTRLIEAVTSVQSALHEMLMSIPVLEANIGHSHRQHASLVTAVVRGRPDRARRVMEEHCDDTAALLRGLLG